MDENGDQWFLALGLFIVLTVGCMLAFRAFVR